MSADTVDATAFDMDDWDFRDHLLWNLYFKHGQALQSAKKEDFYTALAYTIRDYLMGRFRRTTQTHYQENPKFVYYLSAEFMPGKQLPQNLLYTDTQHLAEEALKTFGFDLEELIAIEAEPGLGNGGLGRLAACFLDSLATLSIPAVGYGIRYEFGIFNQTIRDGWQVETPDEWLLRGNPWEFSQPDNMVDVGFWGHTEVYYEASGKPRRRWLPGSWVRGEPCAMLVPGYGTQTVNRLRLWRARATEEFDFRLFNVGDYAKAVEQKVLSENIGKVLYPNDERYEGKRLRLQQQYFLVTCSIHDIIRRFHLRNHDWDTFPDKVAIQLNDTHPVVAIPEMMRVLIDENDLEWDRAWDITRRTFAYTCHTLMPEALEKWPVDLFGELLPRHLEIIYEINHRFLEEVRARYPGDTERVGRMSLIEEVPFRQLRMAHLATVGSFAVNGVAALHSDLLTEQTLSDFAAMWPEKFQNKTNGVTPRRFLQIANPPLSGLITDRIGDGWLRHLEQLAGLEKFADDKAFQSEWSAVKRQNKETLSRYLGLPLDPDSIFDVMVKRLHEYKRQLLKILHTIWLYQQVKAHRIDLKRPRTIIIGGKAAPGYFMAKLIIKLVHSVGKVVDADPEIGGRIRVVFPVNFNVSNAQRIYPAADISEQISMAGKEASGTGNMKMALNGAVTVGTLDGANIEIRDRVGAENFFLFGLSADEVFDLKKNGYRPIDHYHQDLELRAVIDAIAGGQFSEGDRDLFRPIVDALLYHDEYLHLADFRAYVDCSERAAAAYEDRPHWTRMSILNAARSGFFSSDRTIAEYCSEIWKVEPATVP